MHTCLILILLVSCSYFNKTEGVKCTNQRRKSICVVGAGAAGLSMTRQLARESNNFHIQVFEKAYEIGGQWFYTDKTDKDNYGNPIHSGILLCNFRLNSPIEANIFLDWPVLEGVNESLPLHSVFQDYLKNYTNHFNLKQYIQFNTTVLNVTLVIKNNQEKWNVTVKNLNSDETRFELFDAVVICNGHYFEALIPKIQGLKDFKGQVLHSPSYRDPEEFRNKTVIIFGAGSSGKDIGQELLNVSSKVYLSHNKLKFPLPRFIQVKGVDKFENGQFVLKDNSSVSDADVLLLCTDYKYSYPFLDKSTGIQVEDKYVFPLYKIMFNAEHPSMSFVGITSGIYSKLPFFTVQTQYILAVLNGKIKLPSKTEMLKETDLKAPINQKAKEAWIYADELASSGNFSSIPEYSRQGDLVNAVFRTSHWTIPKTINYSSRTTKKL